MIAKNGFPDFSEENALRKSGRKMIAGVDEVGRGPLAGPVMAAAVILPSDNHSDWMSQINDSKKLTERKRELLYDEIMSKAIATGVGAVSPAIIDTRGIASASRMAMKLAIAQLEIKPDFLLIDAVELSDIDIPQKSIVRGDGKSVSIAAASIVAKVTRDHYMMGIDAIYRGYGFARHKGYPTAEHMTRLEQFGACCIHRMSFTPVKRAMNRETL